jgi:ABC-type phosphate transport system ATPase subunit
VNTYTLTVEARIDELKERNTIVIVIVTHNMQQAGRVADATVFLLDGELIEHGPTLEIFAAPKRRTHQAVGERKVRVSAMLGPGSGNHLALAEQRRATRPNC